MVLFSLQFECDNTASTACLVFCLGCSPECAVIYTPQCLELYHYNCFRAPGLIRRTVPYYSPTFVCILEGHPPSSTLTVWPGNLLCAVCDIGSKVSDRTGPDRWNRNKSPCCMCKPDLRSLIIGQYDSPSSALSDGAGQIVSWNVDSAALYSPVASSATGVLGGEVRACGA